MSTKGTAREPLWTEADLMYLREHYARDEPLTDIAAALGRGYKAVSTKASRLGFALRKQPRPWTADDDVYLREHYETMATVELARALGRTHATIKQRADRLGLLSVSRRTRAALCHDYFNDINSHLKAYVLGLWASDGWVASDRNEIGLRLHRKDEALVHFARDEIAPLSRVTVHHDGRMANLRVSSAQMRDDLIRLGVTPRKSLSLKWPTGLPEHLANSFILGCFDGDGCLSYESKRGYYHWSLVSASRPFLEQVQVRLRSATGVKIQGPYSQRNGNRALIIGYTGPSIYAIDAWLHADVAGLARKRPDGRDITARGAGRRRGRAPGTHCRQGHERNAANTRIDKHGNRVCRPCKRRLNQKYRERAQVQVRAGSP